MSSEKEDDWSPPGQCHSNVLLEQRGWDKICCFEQTHSGYSVLLESLHNFNSSSPSWSGESGSGCPLKGSGFKGMVLEPKCGGEDFQEIRETSGGSVRLQEVYSSPHLLLSGEERQEVNALDQDWNFTRMYVFPPPQLIPLILAKLRGCRRVLIMVTAFWTRSALLSELLQLSTVPPLRLPDRPNTVLDLTSGNTLPSLSKLRLTVWSLCSTGSEEKEQIRPWRNLSATLGEAPQGTSTDVHGGLDQNGVTDTLYLNLAPL